MAEESAWESALLSEELVLLDAVDEPVLLLAVGPKPFGMPLRLGGPRLMISSAAMRTLSCRVRVALELVEAACECECAVGATEGA